MTLRRYVEQTYLPAQVTEATTMHSTESRFRTRILQPWVTRPWGSWRLSRA
jgi:hypothetical protein